MDWRTSGSCAHSRTWCRPRRPSTIDNAVPQAPAPMMAISLTPCSSSAPQGKTMFGAGDQARDVLMMSGDDEQSDSHCRAEHVLHRPAALHVQKVDGGGQDGGSDY